MPEPMATKRNGIEPCGMPNTSILQNGEKMPLSRKAVRKFKKMWSESESPLAAMEREWWELRDGEEVRLPARVLWMLGMRMSLRVGLGSQWPKKAPRVLTDYEELLKYMLRPVRWSCLYHDFDGPRLLLQFEQPYAGVGPEYAEDIEEVASELGLDWVELGSRCGLGKVKWGKVARVGAPVNLFEMSECE